MFTIKTNQTPLTDENGKRYILHPISGERIYEYFPPLVENNIQTVKADLPIIEGLYPKIDNANKSNL